MKRTYFILSCRRAGRWTPRTAGQPFGDFSDQQLASIPNGISALFRMNMFFISGKTK
ncbi:MAG: hypothetical protein ABI863_19890 [Ginsengibacter sp.]